MTRTPWIWLILTAAAIAPFIPSLQGGFVFDDEGVILDNPAVWAASPADAARSSYWPAWPEAGLYRPVTTLSYWLTARVSGRAAWAFHAGNLILNAAVTLLLAGVLLQLFPRRRGTALAASLIFALHPLHAEAVASIVGRAELWAAFWSLLAYSLILRPSPDPPVRVLLSSAAFALALLSKESAAGLLALPALHLLPWAVVPEGDDQGRRRIPGRSHRAAWPAPGWSTWLMTGAGWASALALVLLLRMRILGSIFGLELVGMIENVLAHVDTWTRVTGAVGFQWILLQRLFLPWTLSADFSYPQLVPTPGWMAAGVLLSLLLIAAVVIAVRRRAWPWLWGLGWIAGTGLLTSNVIFPLGTVLAERLAYLPSAGVFWLMALAFAWLARVAARPIRTALWALVIIWITFLFVRSILRSCDWRSDLTIFKSAATASPRSAKMWANLSGVHLEAGRLSEGLEAGRVAVSLLPDYPIAARSLASGLLRADRAEEALEVLSAARERGDRDATYQLVLGNVLLALGRGDEAEQAFRRAASLARIPDTRAVVGLASSLALQRRWTESRGTWREAIMRDPSNAEYTRAWAYTVWQAGSPDSAEAIYRELLHEAPGNPLVLNDLSWFLAASGRDTEEALILAGRAFSMDPTRQTGDTLLEAMIRARGCEHARAWADSLDRAGTDDGVMTGIRGGLEARCGSDQEPDRDAPTAPGPWP